MAVGEEADRLSRIKQSYHTAARTYAFRYLYDGHILYYNMLEQVKGNSADTSKTEAVQLKNVNINALNPEILQNMIKETGAKSTDLQSPESAEHLCAKCDRYAENWKPVAEEMWKEDQERKAAKKGC